MSEDVTGVVAAAEPAVVAVDPAPPAEAPVTQEQHESLIQRLEHEISELWRKIEEMVGGDA